MIIVYSSDRSSNSGKIVVTAEAVIAVVQWQQ